MTEYQVFISRKHLDDDGEKTPEVEIAHQLYNHLVGLGISVFLDDISLMQQGHARYKRVIDDALDQATVLIAVGTSRENLESEWVRYEWDGFFNDIISGIKPAGQVVSLVSGLQPASLPRALRQAQSFDYEDGGIASISEFLMNALGIRAPSPSRRRGAPSLVDKPTKVQIAVLFMDISGTSRLYKEHGEETTDRILAKTIHDWTKLTESNHGWVIKVIGDEVMCSFDSANDCVDAALEIRQEIAIGVRGESVGIRVHMGLSFGEGTRHPDNDVYGPVVNMAARMTGISEADQIILDEGTMKRLSPELRSRCTKLGETSLRNVDHPVSYYSIV